MKKTDLGKNSALHPFSDFSPVFSLDVQKNYSDLDEPMINKVFDPNYPREPNQERNNDLVRQFVIVAAGYCFVR
jgi:hypothetical protein